MVLLLCGCSFHIGGVQISGLSPNETRQPKPAEEKRAAWSLKTGDIEGECDVARVVEETVEWSINGIKDIIGLLIKPFGTK